MNTLFDKVEQREGWATNGETNFEFLQRGGRPETAGIREWMEKWFARFPDGTPKNKLPSRLKSSDSGVFLSALFELQVFAMLSKLNCEVEIEPPFNNTAGTVDFFARNCGQQFFVEATTVGPRSGVLPPSQYEDELVKEIKDSLIDPHSDIVMQSEGKLNTGFDSQDVIKSIQDLLCRNSAEMVNIRGESEQIIVCKENWKLGIRLEPRLSEKQAHIWGPIRSGAINAGKHIARALRRKAWDWKQKNLEDEIFLIAVNVCSPDYLVGDDKDEKGGIYKSNESSGFEKVFLDRISGVSGVLLFGKAILGRHKDAPVQLHRNQGKSIPDCLQFLECEQQVGRITGFMDETVEKS